MCIRDRCLLGSILCSSPNLCFLIRHDLDCQHPFSVRIQLRADELPSVFGQPYLFFYFAIRTVLRIPENKQLGPRRLFCPLLLRLAVTQDVYKRQTIYRRASGKPCGRSLGPYPLSPASAQRLGGRPFFFSGTADLASYFWRRRHPCHRSGSFHLHRSVRRYPNAAQHLLPRPDHTALARWERSRLFIPIPLCL